MSRTIIKKALVAALAAAGVAHAGEFTSPQITERGPLRYIVQHDKSDTWSLNFWSALSTREAHKSYQSSSSKTQELSALLFNSSDFRAREMLYNVDMNPTAEFYNPYVQCLRMQPRVQRSEKSITLGGRWEYPVFEDKGRLFVRATVPFRQVEMERGDEAGRDSNQVQDLYMTRGVVAGGIAGATTQQVPVIRLDFLEAALNNETDRISQVADDGGAFAIGGQHVAAGDGQDDAFAVVSNEGFIPRQGLAVLGDAAAAATALATDPRTVTADAGLTPYRIAGDYSALLDGAEGAVTVANKLARADMKARVWVIPTLDAGDGNILNAALAAVINHAGTEYSENHYEWLADRGMIFETKRRMGLGDIDVDFGYEHLFSNELVAEVAAGLRVPTAGKNKYRGNPYYPVLGNGGHVELKLEGMLAWQPLDWMNIKADVSYAWALKAREQLAASFTGATVKGIGPRADADVDYGYFVGHLDFNFFHQKDHNLSAMVGYELYLKGKDHVHYKDASMATWLGRNWNTRDLVYEADLKTLNNAGAEKNTDRISHKIRSESSWRATEWLELFTGGSFSFAGKNTPVETDIHVGMNVTF